MYFDKGNSSSTVYFTSKHIAQLWLAFLLQPGYHKQTNKQTKLSQIPSHSFNMCHNFLAPFITAQ